MDTAFAITLVALAAATLRRILPSAPLRLALPSAAKAIVAASITAATLASVSWPARPTTLAATVAADPTASLRLALTSTANAALAAAAATATAYPSTLVPDLPGIDQGNAANE